MKKPVFEIVLLIAITALVFLPNIGHLTYFKDDWYYIYDGYIAGPDVFYNMFSIDRPARGPFFDIYYSLFEYHALPYHIGAYLWRALAALGALWLFRLIWPRERKFTFFAALLFAVYPGYYWWVSAIEYQPMIASLALQVFSIAFTLKAILSQNRISKLAWLLGAILTGWVCIALVDYAIGMEVFRFLCVFALVNSGQPALSFWRRALSALRAWAIYLLVPLGFLFWRTFFFENQRRATDILAQLGALFGDPASTGPRWAIQFFNSLMNLGALAWVAQFPRFFFAMRLRDVASALAMAFGVLVLTAVAERWMKPIENGTSSEVRGEAANAFSKEVLWIGLLGMGFGILPIIASNRYVNLEGFSHYALPASLAASLFAAGLVHAISFERVRQAAIYALVFFAALAHFSISVSAVNEEKAIQTFWWQVSWRVPALKPETTLAIQYPSPNIGDDGFGVMEAANLLYFPNEPGAIPVHYPLSAVSVNDENVKLILRGKLTRETAYRSHTSNFDFGNVLVLSQPTPSSCVRVIDGERYLVSTLDPSGILLIAPHSRIENVLADVEPIQPQEFAFGKEPARKWCYYFEKADLAVQQQNWEQAASLGDEAMELGLHPEDQAEWFPFLQAYAVLGDEVKVRMTSKKINTEPFLRDQTCLAFTRSDLTLDEQMQVLVNDLFCH